MIWPEILLHLHFFIRGSPVNREAAIHSVALKLRGGALEDYCEKSWEWMAELGAPAALVGGAALASFFELRDRCDVVTTATYTDAFKINICLYDNNLNFYV